MLQRLKSAKQGKNNQNYNKQSTDASTSNKKSTVTDKKINSRNIGISNQLSKGSTATKPGLNRKADQAKTTRTAAKTKNYDDKATIPKAKKNTVPSINHKPFPLNGHAGCVLYILQVNCSNKFHIVLQFYILHLV